MNTTEHNEKRAEWLAGFDTMSTAQERVYFDAGVITACEFEFGPHEDHSDCDRMLATMSGDDFYDDTDYSDWYGGERGYNDGLRWSDFI